MGQIIEFPDIKNGKEKILELRKSLENYILERDYLQFVVCENIGTSYMLIFGSLEYRIYESYCRYLRLHRKKELIQAKINRGEKANMDVIESKLDEEFIEYKKKLEEKIFEINRAIERSKFETLNEEESAQLKKLYRGIVKSLHPDLNPAISNGEKDLFYKASDSYEQGDICTLQIIYEIVQGTENREDVPLSNSSLGKEIERLENLVEEIQKDIETIKTNPPYTWKIYIDDEEKRTKKLNELTADLKSFEEGIRTQEEYIESLMRDSHE